MRSGMCTVALISVENKANDSFGNEEGGRNMDQYRKELYDWCAVPADELENHPDRKIPFRMVEDSRAMGLLMAEELVEEIEKAMRKERNSVLLFPADPAAGMRTG